MNNFIWYNPTRILFGRGTHNEVGRETAAYSRRILLLYGGESLKAAGTYGAITKSLTEAGVEYRELGASVPIPDCRWCVRGFRCAGEKGWISCWQQEEAA